MSGHLAHVVPGPTNDGSMCVQLASLGFTLWVQAGKITLTINESPTESFSFVKTPTYRLSPLLGDLVQQQSLEAHHTEAQRPEPRATFQHAQIKIDDNKAAKLVSEHNILDQCFIWSLQTLTGVQSLGHPGFITTYGPAIEHINKGIPTFNPKGLHQYQREAKDWSDNKVQVLAKAPQGQGKKVYLDPNWILPLEGANRLPKKIERLMLKPRKSLPGRLIENLSWETLMPWSRCIRASTFCNGGSTACIFNSYRALTVGATPSAMTQMRLHCFGYTKRSKRICKNLKN